MMYRWKFEELDRQVKLLPAPVEVVSSKLTELESTLQAERTGREEARQAIAMMELELKAAREALETERSRPWWKRAFGRRR